MTKEEKKRKVWLALVNNPDADTKTLVRELNVKPSAVIRFRKEFKEAKENGTVMQLIGQEHILEAAQSLLLKENSEALSGEIIEATEKISKAVRILEGVEEEFAITAELLARKMQAFVFLADSPSELAVISSSLCNLQRAFFDKNLVEINNNTQNNYGDFLNDKPADNQ